MEKEIPPYRYQQALEQATTDPTGLQLRFNNTDVEQEFVAFLHNSSQVNCRPVAGLGLFCLLMFMVWDSLWLGAHSSFFPLLISIRAIAMLPMLIILFAPQSIFLRWQQQIVMLAAVLICLSTSFATLTEGLAGLQVQMESLVLCNIFVFLLSGLLFFRKLIAALALNCSQLLAMVLCSAPPLEMINLLLFQSLLVLICSYHSIHHERLLRSNYVHSRLLKCSQSVDRQSELWNRHKFDAHLHHLIGEADTEHSSFALAIIDIDEFRHYNDHYGSLAGDDALSRLSRTLKGLERQDRDLVVRLGGEEFMVILWAVDAAAAEEAAEGLLDSVRALAIEHEQSAVMPYLTISIGMSLYHPQHPISKRELLQKADQALLQAKRSGSNGYHLQGTLPQHSNQAWAKAG